MARHPRVPGLRVVIEVGGIALREYDSPEPPSPFTITKYIEARSGAEFSIRFSYTEPITEDQGLMMQISLDGRQIRRGGLACRREDLIRPKGCAMRGHSMKKNDAFYMQNFRFSELKVVDEKIVPNHRSLLDQIQHLGEVKLDFYYINSVVLVGPSGVEDNVTELGPIPETKLKGKEDPATHQVGLSAPVAVTAPKEWCTYTMGSESPFVTFIFKYRSIEVLRAAYIAPQLKPLEEHDTNSLSVNGRREQLLTSNKREPEQSDRMIKPEPGYDGEDKADDEIVLVKSTTKRRKVKQAAYRRKDVVVIDDK